MAGRLGCIPLPLAELPQLFEAKSPAAGLEHLRAPVDSQSSANTVPPGCSLFARACHQASQELDLSTCS